MPQFTDIKGRKYDIVVTVQTAIDFKETLGLDLNTFAEQATLDRLASDVKLVVAMLWTAVCDAAAGYGLSETEFGKQLGGDAYAQATDALLDAIVLFFRPSQRPALQRLLDKGREVETLAGQQVLQRIESVSSEAILTSLITASSKEESSSKTLDHSPSGS